MIGNYSPIVHRRLLSLRSPIYTTFYSHSLPVSQCGPQRPLATRTEMHSYLIKYYYERSIYLLFLLNIVGSGAIQLLCPAKG